MAYLTGRAVYIEYIYGVSYREGCVYIYGVSYREGCLYIWRIMQWHDGGVQGCTLPRPVAASYRSTSSGKPEIVVSFTIPACKRFTTRHEINTTHMQI